MVQDAGGLQVQAELLAAPGVSLESVLPRAGIRDSCLSAPGRG